MTAMRTKHRPLLLLLACGALAAATVRAADDARAAADDARVEADAATIAYLALDVHHAYRQFQRQRKRQRLLQEGHHPVPG